MDPKIASKKIEAKVKKYLEGKTFIKEIGSIKRAK